MQRQRQQCERKGRREAQQNVVHSISTLVDFTTGFYMVSVSQREEYENYEEQIKYDRINFNMSINYNLIDL